jgi:hypothetical protein
MKYFTREIWAGWQGDDTTCARAMRQWKMNLRRYQSSLRKTAPRLKDGKFFTDHSLHDGSVLEFTFADWPQGKLPSRATSPKTLVRFTVLTGTRTADIYELLYAQVAEVSVVSRNDLFPLEDSLFGDWGYDELLLQRGGLYRHNILFQTGTEVSIVFREFQFTKRKATPSMLRRYSHSGLKSRLK